MANSAHTKKAEDVEDDWAITTMFEASSESEDEICSPVEPTPSSENIDQAGACERSETQIHSLQNPIRLNAPGPDDDGFESMKIDATTKAILRNLLLPAIRGGYETLTVALVEKGADPNSRDSYGFALTQAIRGGYETLAVALVEKGADPNSRDSYGFALTQAIRGGYEGVMWALLEHNADPDVKDSYGSALTLAIRAGYETFAVALVEKGADPRSRDSYGSAVAQAVRYGLTKLQKVLLGRGAEAPTTTRKALENGQRWDGAVKISGNIPPGMRLKISTDEGFVQIDTSSGISVCSVSTSSTSAQSLRYITNLGG